MCQYHLKIKTVDTEKFNEFRYTLWTFVEEPYEYYYLGEIKIVFSLDKNEGRLLDNNYGKMVFYDKQGKEIKSKQVKIKKLGADHALLEVK